MSFWEALEKKEKGLREKGGRMAWLCSYTPVEIISCCGLLPYRIFATESKPVYGSSLLHTTLCPYARSALDEILEGEKKGMAGAVLVSSCNAILHLYHALEHYSNLPFKYLLDLPRENSQQAIAFYAGSLRKFHLALSAYCGLPVREDDLWEQINLYAENRRGLTKLYLDSTAGDFPDGSELFRLARALMLFSARDFRRLFHDYGQKILQEKKGCPPGQGPRLFLTGGMAPYYLLKLGRELGGRLALDDLCSGKRALDFRSVPVQGENPYQYLARLYLKRAPCARMKHAADQLPRLAKLLQEHDIDGILFFYLKFCDPWYYYGQLLKEKLSQIPVLVLEAEQMGSSAAGQHHTRIAAFLEMLSEAREVSFK